MSHPLDNPAWSSLHGAHQGFAQRHGSALRYPREVTVFAALPDDPAPVDWDDLAAMTHPGEQLVVICDTARVPRSWRVDRVIGCLQLVGGPVDPQPFHEATELGPQDVEDVLALIAHAQPGPFLPGTIQLGTYLGVRREGQLVAMAGERMHPEGWTEVSAVATHASVRGQRLAPRIMGAVCAGIRARGETPMLHVADTNTTAIKVYEDLGFTHRRWHAFNLVSLPDMS